MKYKYTGEQEVHLPKLGILVQPGDTVETEQEINHTDFELVQSKSQEKREAVQKEDKKEEK